MFLANTYLQIFQKKLMTVFVNKHLGKFTTANIVFSLTARESKKTIIHGTICHFITEKILLNEKKL